MCLLLMLTLTTGCDNESYESGDGKYSHLNADFGMVQTKQSQTLVAATFDDGRAVEFQPTLTCEWADVPAATYRALVYYYPTSKDNVVKPYSALPVYILRWKDKDYTSNTMLTDPVHVESLWLSKNKEYINLRLGIMVGTEEDGSRQQQLIGITLDNTQTNADNTHTYTVTLRHAQNNVPQYYTSQQYLSLPLHECQSGDNIILHVNTYEGEKTYNMTI